MSLRAVKHRITDPACAEFAGAGREWRLFGLSIRSPRRVAFDYSRGRPCVECFTPPMARVTDMLGDFDAYEQLTPWQQFIYDQLDVASSDLTWDFPPVQRVAGPGSSYSFKPIAIETPPREQVDQGLAARGASLFRGQVIAGQLRHGPVL